MKSAALFALAVAVLYFGGFVYDEVSPLLYAVVLTLIASIPLILKTTFWKKIIFMVPLLVLRVIGKVLLSVFGKNALSKLLARYGLLEERFNRSVQALLDSKNSAMQRWYGMSRSSQAYLLMIFLPVAIVILLMTIVIKFVRLRFLQFFIEKVMQRFVMKWTVDKNRQQQIEGSEPIEKKADGQSNGSDPRAS